MSDVLAVIDRMKRALGVDTDSQMLETLKLSSGAAAQWKKRGKVPRPYVQLVSERTGYREQWIETGSGEVRFERKKRALDSLPKGRATNACAMMFKRFKGRTKSLRRNTDYH